MRDTNSLILTHTGRLVDPLHLTEDDVCLEDVAHALALVNRFGGHSKRPLSVAQHSVFVSYLCTTLQALLHDASEAYIGDVCRPLKRQPDFLFYRAVEEQIQSLIFHKYGCDVVESDELRRADLAMCRWEAEHAMTLPAVGAEHLNCMTIEITDAQRTIVVEHDWCFWTWERAEREFLERFNTIGRGK